MTDQTTTAGPARALPEQFGPRPAWLRRGEAHRQVQALGARLEKRAWSLAESANVGEIPAFAAMAETLAQTLLDTRNAEGRQSAARLIADTLLDVGEREEPTFWVTDLGRAIAREIGYVAPWVPHAVTQSVLRVSRQAIDQMAAKGRLDMEARQISRESLKRAAAERWPHGNDV